MDEENFGGADVVSFLAAPLSLTLEIEKSMEKITKIRAVNLDDCQELFAQIIKNQKYLSRWLPWPSQTKEPEDTVNFIKIVNQMRNEKKALFCSVVSSEKLVGVVGANLTSKAPQRARLNYWIDEESSGKNKATSSTQQLISYLRKEWKIDKFEIHICTENLASIKVAKKLDFRLLRMIENAEKLNGKRVNNYVFTN